VILVGFFLPSLATSFLFFLSLSHSFPLFGDSSGLVKRGDPSLSAR